MARITRVKNPVPNEYLPLGTIPLPAPLVAVLRRLATEGDAPGMAAVVRAALISTYGSILSMPDDEDPAPTAADF